MTRSLESRLGASIAKIDPAYQSGALADIEVLREAGGTASFERLLQLVKDTQESSQVRTIACSWLGRLGDKRAVPTLKNALQSDADPKVREASAYALGELNDKRAVPALKNALQSDADPKVREAAAYALGWIWTGKKEATEALVRALSDRAEQPAIRGVAADSLSRQWVLGGNPEVVEALVAACEDPSPEVRYWSAFALGEVSDVRALPTLERLAKTDDGVAPNGESVSEEAMAAIKRIGENQIVGRAP